MLALAAGAVVQAGRGRDRHARYVAGVVTLAAMLVAPVATFAWIATRQACRSTDGRAGSADDAGACGRCHRLDATRGRARAGDPHGGIGTAGPRSRRLPRPRILVVWFAGVVALSLRLLGGWVVARRLATQAVRPASAGAARARAPNRRPAGARPRRVGPRVVEVRVPVIVGWLKPVVLLPAAALSSLSPDRSKRSSRTSWRTSAGTTISSICCSPPSRRCSSITRRSGGSRGRCAPSASIAATTSRSRCAIGSSTSVRLPIWRRMTTAHGTALAATDGSLVRRVRRLLGADAGAAAERPGSFAVLTLIVLGAVALPAALTSREVAAPPPASSPEPRPITTVAAPLTNPNPPAPETSPSCIPRARQRPPSSRRRRLTRARCKAPPISKSRSGRNKS